MIYLDSVRNGKRENAKGSIYDGIAPSRVGLGPLIWALREDELHILAQPTQERLVKGGRGIFEDEADQGIELLRRVLGLDAMPLVCGSASHLGRDVVSWRAQYEVLFVPSGNTHLFASTTPPHFSFSGRLFKTCRACAS